MPMEVNEALPEYKRYTYEDYCSWDDDKLWELIDGMPYAMAAPSQRHQEILLQLGRMIGNFLVGKTCKVFVAPFAVRLNEAYGDDTVLLPDLLVVCDMAKLDGKCCVGAPDMAIEILSPSTAVRDRVIKLKRYLNAGVREYWIVDPDSRTISVHLLMDRQYVISAYAYGEDAAVPIHVLDGCTIDLTEVFEE